MDTAKFPPIFVVGTGRSGTTLLSTVLSSHSRIAFPPETHFMRRAELNGLANGAPQDFDAFWDTYSKWSRFEDLGVAAEDCLAVLEEMGDKSFKSIFAASLEAFRRKEGKARVGEKTPRHRIYIPLLLSWYPSSRVVVIRRDPRAVIASQLKCPWVEVTACSLRKGVLADSRMSKVIFYAENWATGYGKDVPTYIEDERVCLITYEDLVQRTEETVQFVCKSIGENYEASMVAKRAGAKVANSTAKSASYTDDWEEWVKSHHARTEKPITADSLSKWKGQLSRLEVLVAEAICAKEMKAAGYSLSTSPGERLLGKLAAIAAKSLLIVEDGVRSIVRRWSSLFRRQSAHSSP